MNRNICIALLTAAFVFNAHAGDAAVARLTAVSGNVLVSNDFNIASAGDSFRLKPGMRVLVTLNSAATIEYDGGCRVRLAAGERLEVRGDSPCTGRPVQPTAVAAIVGIRK